MNAAENDTCKGPCKGKTQTKLSRVHPIMESTPYRLQPSPGLDHAARSLRPRLPDWMQAVPEPLLWTKESSSLPPRSSQEGRRQQALHGLRIEDLRNFWLEYATRQPRPARLNDNLDTPIAVAEISQGRFKD